MGRRSNYQKTDLSSIPSEFDLDKYDFKDDSELWFAALTLRFELKREVEEFLAWGGADDEFSEQRLELRDDAISRLQKKILLLMEKPCSLNSDNSARPPELRHVTAGAESSAPASTSLSLAAEHFEFLLEDTPLARKLRMQAGRIIGERGRHPLIDFFRDSEKATRLLRATGPYLSSGEMRDYVQFIRSTLIWKEDGRLDYSNP